MSAPSSTDSLTRFEVPRLRSLDGRLVTITDLYKDRKVVLVFLRHLGCRFCWQLADDMSSIKDKLGAADVDLIAVSLGTTKQANEFMVQSKFKGTLYTELESAPDARYYAYESFKLKRGRDDFVANFERSKVKGAEAAAKGYTEHAYFAGSEQEWSGDFSQVGGVFVVGPGNVCDYSFRSEYAGDHPDLQKVMEAATGSEASGEHIFPSTEAWFKRLKAGQLAPAPAKPKGDNDTDVGPGSTGSPDSAPLLAPQDTPITPPVFIALLLVGAVAILATRPRYHRLAQAWFEAQPFIVGNAIGLVITVLYFWHRSYSYGPPSPRTASQKSRRPNTSPEEPSNGDAMVPASLYSPKDVDALVLKSGLIECDCNGIMDSIPVDTVAEATHDESPAHGRAHALSVDPSAEDTLTAMATRAKALSTASTGSFTHDPDAVEDVTPQLDFFRQTTCYLREFLAKPHPMVGRPGPVCPFVPSALKMDTIKLACIRTPKRPNKETLKTLVREYLAIFNKMEPTKGRKKLYKAILLIFPDIEDADAHEYIDKIQYELKPEFVELGLMLGEFHLNNNSHGLHNKSFYPLRTPHPVLAIRHMAPTDIVFLDMDQYPAQRRVEFLTQYLSQFENDPKESQKKEVKAAKQALADARAALASA